MKALHVLGVLWQLRGERQTMRSDSEAVRGSNEAERTFLSWACALGVSILISDLSV